MQMFESKLVFTESKLKYCVREKISDGPHETPDFIDNGVPFLSIDGIQNGKIILDNCRFISEEDHKKYNEKIKVEEDDILMGKAASIGKIARVTFSRPLSIWSPLAVIKSKRNIINPIFLEYFLKSDFVQDQIQILATSNTQKNISMKDIERIKVVYPDLNYQNIISRYLDNRTHRIELLIKKIEKKIELYKEYKNALIHQMITKGLDPKVDMKNSGVEWIGETPKNWEIIKIKHLSFVRRGSSPRPIDDPKYFDEDGEFSWVRISDVSSSGKYLLKTTQRLSDLGSSLSTPMEIGDLFLSIAGSVGKPIITKIKCCIHDGFVWFDDISVNRDYLFYIFLCGSCFTGLGKMGTQLNLNTDTVGQIKIPFPKLNLQKKIVEQLELNLEVIDKLIVKSLNKLNLLREYRQSLISSVVTGKIRITDDML